MRPLWGVFYAAPQGPQRDGASAAHGVNLLSNIPCFGVYYPYSASLSPLPTLCRQIFVLGFALGKTKLPGKYYDTLCYVYSWCSINIAGIYEICLIPSPHPQTMINTGRRVCTIVLIHWPRDGASLDQSLSAPGPPVWRHCSPPIHRWSILIFKLAQGWLRPTSVQIWTYGAQDAILVAKCPHLSALRLQPSCMPAAHQDWSDICLDESLVKISAALNYLLGSSAWNCHVAVPWSGTTVVESPHPSPWLTRINLLRVASAQVQAQIYEESGFKFGVILTEI